MRNLQAIQVWRDGKSTAVAGFLIGFTWDSEQAVLQEMSESGPLLGPEERWVVREAIGLIELPLLSLTTADQTGPSRR